MNVRLDPKDQKELEALAEQIGKDPDELLRQLVHEALSERKRNGTETTEGAEESFLDAAHRIGAVGCVKGGPSDLSTNPKYMEGFGED